MLSSPGALLRFSLFIDASNSGGSMDGHVSLDQLKLFLIYTVLH